MAVCRGSKAHLEGALKGHYDTLVQMALYLAQYNRILHECIEIVSFSLTAPESQTANAGLQ